MLTLAVDQETQQAWDELRRTWFPPSRLLVGAHLTLFHTLPGAHSDAIVAACAELAAGTPPFPLTVDGVRSLGRGTALTVSSPVLAQLHQTLQRRWRPWLTAQDAQPLRPHVTVQNKVSPQTAAETLDLLRADFTPAEATATGLDAWHYLGGPWRPLASLPFTG
ncbi:2'-5' RNA ligase family protein [Amycolatopsis magusensis]|uniref:2'-5' RNA ligase family protein n=1 Tax=Amycolatopsis magusensis TaxID=882444 RepID=UPI00378BBD07